MQINMEQLTKRLTIKYAILQSTYWISQCLVGGFAAVYLHSKHFDNTQIGIILSAASGLSVLIQVGTSAFADKTKRISLRYIVIFMMCIVFAFALILYAAPYSFSLVAVSYILINAIQSALNFLFNALAVEYIDKGIMINYGLARGMGSISFAVTSYLMGICITTFGPEALLPVFILSYCAVISAAFAFRAAVPLTNKVRFEETCRSDRIPENEKKPAGILSFFLRYKKFTVQLLGIAMLFYSHSVICTYLINIIEHVGGNGTDMGISLAITAAVELPMMAGFAFLIKKLKCSLLIKISAFFFLIKVGTAWLAPNVITVHISQFLQVFSYALFTPASVYYANTVIHKQDRIKGQSMLGAAMCISGTVANITGGRLLDAVGVGDMLFFATVITAIGFITICISTDEIKTI